MFVQPTEYLQLLLYYLGTFEAHCLPYFRHFAKPGATVIDVGANVGFYTIEGALAVGNPGHVVSIEAAPPHIAALRANVELNGFRNVSIIEGAVGNTTINAKLSLPAAGNEGMYTLGRTNSGTSFIVQMRRLDDVLDELALASVDVIKMDIEGSEFQALSGASRTLAMHRPAILIELNETALSSCGASSRQVKELLRAAGYRGWAIGRKGAYCLEHKSDFHDCDECLFLPVESPPTLLSKLRLPQE